MILNIDMILQHRAWAMLIEPSFRPFQKMLSHSSSVKAGCGEATARLRQESRVASQNSSRVLASTFVEARLGYGPGDILVQKALHRHEALLSHTQDLGKRSTHESCIQVHC